MIPRIGNKIKIKNRHVPDNPIVIYPGPGSIGKVMSTAQGLMVRFERPFTCSRGLKYQLIPGVAKAIFVEVRPEDAEVML